MRSHGLADFPPATVTEDGRVTLSDSATNAANATGVDPFDATYRAALDACASHLPDGTTFPEPPPAPSVPDTPDDLAPDGCLNPPPTPTPPDTPT